MYQEGSIGERTSPESLKDVARLGGIAQQTICNWERAKSLSVRTFRNVERICQPLEIDYQEIVDRFCPVLDSIGQGFDLNLIKARIRKGLTQEKTARDAGIDPTTLRRWDLLVELDQALVASLRADCLLHNWAQQINPTRKVIPRVFMISKN